MSRFPRKICPDCGRSLAIRASGLFPFHRADRSSPKICPHSSVRAEDTDPGDELPAREKSAPEPPYVPPSSERYWIIEIPTQRREVWEVWARAVELLGRTGLAPDEFLWELMKIAREKA